MTHEIKFRGYSIDQDKWIYGNLVKQNNEFYIIPVDTDWQEEIINVAGFIRRRFEVDPKSVGQLIWNTNVGELYEDDIICISVSFPGGSQEDFNYILRYDGTGFSPHFDPFYLEGETEIIWEWIASDFRIPDFQREYLKYHYFDSVNPTKIIGNYFENPELIGIPRLIK